jgi:hypothetical protein
MINKSPHEVYLSQMVELKRRFRAIDSVLGAKKPVTKFEDIDLETVFLQIRKIVELISFSAIVADEKRYQNSRQDDAKFNPKEKGDYTLEWNAANMLIHLSRISPHFLPQALGLMSVNPDGSKHFNGTAAKATHDRLISIYKVAGGYLHIPNPFKSGVAEQQVVKKETARTVIETDVAYLKSIIWEHVKIGLVWKPGFDPKAQDNSETAWMVWFGDKNTNQVRMSLANAI